MENKMKNNPVHILIFAGAIVISVIGYRVLDNFIIQPFKKPLLMEKTVNDLINEMKDTTYYLYSYRFAPPDNIPPLACFIACERPFKIERDAEYFLLAFEKLISLLNKGSLSGGSESKYNRNNIEFIINWDANNIFVDKTTFGVLKNWSNDTVLLGRYEGGAERTTKIIPYGIFKRLVEEKKFDEILFYGE